MFETLKPEYQKVKRAVKDTAYGKTKDTAVDVQTAEMTDARRGIIFYLSKLTAEREPFESDLVTTAFDNFVGSSEMVKDAATVGMGLINKVSALRGGIAKVQNKVKTVKDWSNDKLKSLINAIKERLEKICKWLSERYGGAGSDIATGLQSLSVFLLANFTKTLADAIPGWGYVQNAGDLYEAAKTGVQGAYRGLKQLSAGWGVELLGGHPALIANALARHAASMVGGALKDLAVSSGTIAATASGDAAAGIGALVSLITGIIKRVLTAVLSFVERWHLNSIFKKAEEEWKIRDNGSSLIASHDEFSKWFQDALIYTPVVGAIVVNCGFAANPIRFLQVLGSSNEIITQGQFDKGVDYIKELQAISVKYIKAYSETYATSFRSDDDYVKNKLNMILA